MQYRYKLAAFLGTGIIATLGTTLCLCALGLLFHLSIGVWQFPLAIALGNAFAIRGLGYRSHSIQEILFRYIFPFLVCILICILLSIYFYDVSYDGQAYHQEAIIQLRNGWNPFYTYLPNDYVQVLWVNHYAKGTELIQSAIYATCGRIEAGKACNFLLFLASFFLSVTFLRRLKPPLVSKSAIALAFLMAANPIVVNQLISFYVDGCMASLLLCLFIQLISLVMFNNYKRDGLVLFFVLILLVNIKFTSFVYAGFFGIFAFIWIVWKRKEQLRHFVLVYSTAVLLGLVVGFNPYYTNFRDYQHPFYPLMGKNKLDIISYNLPQNFDKMSGLERFMTSLFSHTANLDVQTDGGPKLKIPFTFNKVDLVNASKVDTRIGGFGPLFSGIIILSVVLFLIYCFYYLRRKEYFFILYILSVFVLSIVLMPESWWARYVPQLWLAPLLLLGFSHFVENRLARRISSLMYVVLFLNIAFNAVNIFWNVAMTAHVDYQLKRLKSSGETIQVEWGSAKSNRIRFSEHGIPYVETSLRRQGTENIVRSDSFFLKPKNYNEEGDKPLLIKWTENMIRDVAL